MSIKKDMMKFTPRQEQLDALDFIKNKKKESPDTKFFLMELPMGVGKSHISVMISDWCQKEFSNSKVDIITAGKLLQDQYGETYDSIKNLKGKENYFCTQYSVSCDSGREFNRLNKTKCEFCPYDDAKSDYIGGKISLTNFYLYLIYAIYNRSILDQRESRILIVDECHDLEDVVSDFISIKITENTIKKLKFLNETQVLRSLKKVKTIKDYIEFLEYLQEEIASTVGSIESSLSQDRDVKRDKRDLKIGKIVGGENNDVKLMHIVRELEQYQQKIDVFLKDYNSNPDNWVLEKNWNDKNKSYELSLEPIWAAEYLEKYLWDNYEMIVLMSGTILDKDLFCELNGIDNKKCVFYTTSSPFPVENRKVYYMPLGKMTFNNKIDTFKNFVPYINKILKKYESVKGIIHTNSFELSEWIQRDLDNSRLIFHTTRDREEMLKFHMDSEDPRVFVSPSVGTGVSFDHDRSRFQIIAKIPYPSLASQKNKLRQKNNPEWFFWKTISQLMQMCGRSIRSKTDYADTIILDGCFSDLVRYNSKYIPSWFQESIKKVEVGKK